MICGSLLYPSNLISFFPVIGVLATEKSSVTFLVCNTLLFTEIDNVLFKSRITLHNPLNIPVVGPDALCISNGFVFNSIGKENPISAKDGVSIEVTSTSPPETIN